MILYRRKINMVPGEVPVFIHMSQYDSDVVLKFDLYASEGTFVVQSGTTALIRGTKPDGNGISLDADIETVNGVTTVTVEVDQQMTAVAGQSLYELSLRKSGEELNTANFILDIERAPLDADTLPSESKIRELVDVIDQADDIIAAAQQVEDALDTIDDTLTQQGKAADAKKVGDEITSVKQDLSEIVPGLSDDAKEALMNCFEHVAWVDEHGQDYYDALYVALYNEEPPAPEPEIPEGYTQFDYIMVNTADTINGQPGLLRKNQILLPLTGDKNTYKYEMLINNYAQQGAATFGGRDSDGNTDSLAFYLTSSDPKTFTIHCRGESYKSATMPSLSQEEHVLHVIFNPSVNPTVVKIDDDTVTRAWANQSQTMSASLALFGNPAPGASNDIYRSVLPDQIGRLKVYNSSDELICDCIPCSNQSGKYGMYDKISETFLTSTSDNTYVCGNWS